MGFYGILLVLVSSFALCPATVDVSYSDELQECLNRFDNDTRTFSEEEKLSLCVKFVYQSNPKLFIVLSEGYSKQEMMIRENYIQSLIDRFTAEARNPKVKRVRKEYRMMTREERENYHRAILMLKNDSTVPPNKFEVIAEIHASKSKTLSAHRGPAFLPWHRIYMMIWEEGLREKVPSVVLPYWDVTRDSAMEDSRNSLLWSPQFVGNGHGLVSTGPFTNWGTIFGPLHRNYAVFGRLMTQANNQTVFTRKTLAEISQQTANEERFVFEHYHNNLHDWIGGQISMLSWAAVDPCFMLIHGFVDYIWYRFQDMQLRNHIAITSDYPSTADYPILNGSFYDGDKPVGIIPGMSNREAVAEGVLYRNLIDYEDIQSECDEQTPCRSSNFECVKGFCELRSADNDICNQIGPLQNNFCVDRNCDTNLFSFLAVEIIHERLESLCDMGNFAVTNGSVNGTIDIYRESASIIHQEKYSNKTTDMCGRPGGCCKPVERINIVFYGDDALWKYQESAFVDSRLAVSHSQLFLAVKKADNSSFFLSAADEYGNLCEAYLVDEFGNKTQLMKSQKITISEDDYRLSDTLSEAVLKMFDYKKGQKLPPDVLQNQYLFSFHCRADRNLSSKIRNSKK